MDARLVMGDMANMNPEGFLFLEGRLAPFPNTGDARISHPATCRKPAESENIPS